MGRCFSPRITLEYTQLPKVLWSRCGVESWCTLSNLESFSRTFRISSVGIQSSGGSVVYNDSSSRFCDERISHSDSLNSTAQLQISVAWPCTTKSGSFEFGPYEFPSLLQSYSTILQRNPSVQTSTRSLSSGDSGVYKDSSSRFYIKRLSRSDSVNSTAQLRCLTQWHDLAQPNRAHPPLDRVNFLHFYKIIPQIYRKINSPKPRLVQARLWE